MEIDRTKFHICTSSSFEGVKAHMHTHTRTHIHARTCIQMHCTHTRTHTHTHTHSIELWHRSEVGNRFLVAGQSKFCRMSVGRVIFPRTNSFFHCFYGIENCRFRAFYSVFCNSLFESQEFTLVVSTFSSFVSVHFFLIGAMALWLECPLSSR